LEESNGRLLAVSLRVSIPSESLSGNLVRAQLQMARQGMKDAMKRMREKDLKATECNSVIEYS
jgi:hypothetical protein